MTRTQPGEPEPHHRWWLHAIEDDLTVPGTAMQVARIFSDYAASRTGCDNASVSYPVLRRQTHRSRDAIDEALTYLTGHGWLTSRPHGNGQRVVYDLTAGHPGQNRKPVRSPDRFEGSDQSGRRTGSDEGYRSGDRTGTSPVTGPLPVRSPDRERLTSDNVSLPRPGSLHAALAAVVPDVTERETQGVIEILRKRGAKSVGAVLRAEIRDGTAGALVDEVRRRWAPTTGTAPRPCDTQFSDQCPRCSLTHDPDRCRESDPIPVVAEATAAPPLKLAAVPPPDAPRCASTSVALGHAPRAAGDGYHDRCRYLAAVKAKTPASPASAQEHTETPRQIPELKGA